MSNVKRALSVVPALNGGWSVLKYGASRASKHFETKEAAEKWGRDLSRKEGADLFIFRLNGTIAARHRYGVSSNRTRDKR